MFDFESFCVQAKNLKYTKTTNWMRKHVSMSIFRSSKLLKESIFLCNYDPHHLVASFIGSLEALVLENKT